MRMFYKPIDVAMEKCNLKLMQKLKEVSIALEIKMICRYLTSNDNPFH